MPGIQPFEATPRIMMLNKLTSIPFLLRFLLCLLVSAGIHGSLTLFEWVSHPPAESDGQSAVVVALVPPVDDPSFAVVDAPENLAEQSPAVTKSRAKVKTVPRVVSRPVAKPLPVIPPKPTQMVEEPEVVEESAEECVQADQACAEPGETLSGIADEAAPIGMSSQDTQGPPPEDNQPADRKTSGQTDDALVEAMPKYRNNPLPEYPYIARQRHWEGVVWLLVDVSAKGLVDDVDVERSCGHRILDRVARKTVKRWEFTPATRAGLPVESQIRIPVRFSLEDS